MSAKLPEGKGVWPAFWMMPENSVYGLWPCSGEIDIMEYSPCTFGKTFFTTLHSGPKPLAHRHNMVSLAKEKLPCDVYSNFHKYGLLWQEDSISVYFDGKKVGKSYIRQDDVKLWPFDQEFHIILNLAMGGVLGGKIDRKLNEAVYEIEYVRVYQ